MAAKKKRRNLFDEITEGALEIKKHQTKKITLRTHEFIKKPKPEISPELIVDTREKLHMSRAVFALRLRVSPRTLEKWEQGETHPNDQAAALILMVRKFPDTLKRLESI